MILLVIFSFVLGAIESAIFSIKSWRNRQLAKEIQNRYFSQLNDTQDLLCTLTLARTVFNSCIIAFFVLALKELSFMYYIVLFCILLILIALFCEIIPKTLALKAPQAWIFRLVKPIYLLHFTIKPLGILAKKISDISTYLFVPKGIITNSIIPT